MKKMRTLFSEFFALLSTLNVSGVMKGGAVYEPLPPHMREEQN